MKEKTSSIYPYLTNEETKYWHCSWGNRKHFFFNGLSYTSTINKIKWLHYYIWDVSHVKANKIYLLQVSSSGMNISSECLLLIKGYIYGPFSFIFNHIFNYLCVCVCLVVRFNNKVIYGNELNDIIKHTTWGVSYTLNSCLFEQYKREKK